MNNYEVAYTKRKYLKDLLLNRNTDKNMTSIELSLIRERHSNHDFQSIPNPLNESNTFQHVLNSTTSETTSTPLKIFWKKPINRALFGTVLFICISMTIGILTVYFTSPNSKEICELTYRPTTGSSEDYDSRPQSVATGYFNNDTYLDFVVANSGIDNINVFLGYDNGIFGNQTIYSTGYSSRPYSVAVGNFNNDNGLDIAVGNFGTNNIGIFLGFNNGTFTIQTTFSTGASHPLIIAVADINDDKRLDIAAVNYGTNSVSIFIGYGNGSFTMFTTYSTSYDSLPYSLAIADINNDNRLDIVIANYGTDNIGIFFGHGNGTFENQKIYSTGSKSNPYSVVIADFNKDNQLDIAVANYGSNNIGLFFGYGNGSFASQITYSTGSSSYPQYIATGDFNRDSQLDIIVTDTNNAMVYILPGQDNGSFPMVTIYFTGFGSSPVSVTVGDFDNDNSSDCLIVDRDTNNLIVLIEYQTIQTARYTTYSDGRLSAPVSIAVGDLNNDNAADLVVANTISDSIDVFFGYGNGSFSIVTSFPIGNGSIPYSVALGDLNNDHQLDIVVANNGGSNIGVLLGYGNGTFSVVTTYSTGNNSLPFSLALGDLNNDKYLDIAVVNIGTNNLLIYLGYGNGTFAIVSTYDTGLDSQPYSVAIGDVDNDNRLDIVVAIYNGSNVVIFLGHGNGTFAVVTRYSTGSFSPPSSVTLGDFNKDSQLDIVVALAYINGVGVFFGYGNGSFANLIWYPLAAGIKPCSLAVGDFNGDSHLDIAVSNFLSDNIVVLLGNNTGNFTQQITYSTGDNSNPHSITFGDFNNDNQLDLAVANSGSSSIGIFINYYSADFLIQRNYSTGSGSHPYSVVVGDFNKDNWLDIAVANSGNDNVGVRLGYGNGTFGIETTYSTGSGSSPQYVILGDFNKDNQTDMVTVNSKSDSISVFFGYNNGTFEEPLTYSTGLQSSPCSIAFGNFNNDIWLDLIVTNEGSDSVGILFGFNYASFDTGQTYFTGYTSVPTSVCVGDFNNDNRLDIVVTNNGLDSISIFFGYGNGTFTTQTTYSTGNNSDPYWIACGDFNNDNCQDIVVANSGTNNVCILLGDCDGNFTTVKTYSTGNGSQPLSVVVGDINNDSKLDIVVANNGTSNVGVLLGFGNGTFSEIITYSTGLEFYPLSVVLGDFTNDGYLDITVIDPTNYNICVFLGYGNGSFASRATYFIGSGLQPYSVTLGDFNNDNQLDIAVACAFESSIVVFYGFGNGSFSNIETFSTGFGSGPNYIITGYFNEDNQLDIAVNFAGNDAVAVLFGMENGSFLIGKKYSTGDRSLVISMAIGDFDNDTNLDIVVANAEAGNVGVFLRNGIEYFATTITVQTALNSQPRSVAIGDFNNDNRSDAVIANYGTNNIVIALGNESTGFSYVTAYSTGNDSYPYAVVVDDFNGDNRLDIVVANSGTNNVMIFQGYGNGMFHVIGSYSTGDSSLPYALAVGDFNNDNRSDIAVANSGTNNILILFGFGNGTFGNQTSYSMGYGSRPYSLALGDFNEDNWIDIAVANYGTDYVEILLKTC